MTLDGPLSEQATLEPAIGGPDFSSLPGTGMLPYVAALLDGEGCIGIQRSGKHRLPTYGVRIDVGMTVKAKPLLDGLANRLGGQVRRTRGETVKWAEAWCWGMHGKPAAEMLASLIPWIQLKREQALLCLAFQSELDRWRAEGHRGNAPWPDWLRAMGLRAWERNRELNAKGPETESTRMPTAYLVNGKWESPAASMFGTRDAVSIPSFGFTRGGVLYGLPMSGPVTAEPACSSLPTPRATRGGSAMETVAMLPTPSASDGTGGHERRGGMRGEELLLAGLAKTLLPTPRTSDANGTGTHGEGGPDLRTQVARLLPTPVGRDHKGRNQRDDETCLPGAVGNLGGEPTDPPLPDTPPPLEDLLLTLWTDGDG